MDLAPNPLPRILKAIINTKPVIIREVVPTIGRPVICLTIMPIPVTPPSTIFLGKIKITYPAADNIAPKVIKIQGQIL